VPPAALTRGMGLDALTGDSVLAALARFDRTAVPTAELAATLDAPKPYLTTHLQQLALDGLVGFNTHRGVRRWRLTAAGREATLDEDREHGGGRTRDTTDPFGEE
jgi:DNA-binding MarR family transcriptional regulator